MKRTIHVSHITNKTIINWRVELAMLSILKTQQPIIGVEWESKFHIEGTVEAQQEVISRQRKLPTLIRRLERNKIVYLSNHGESKPTIYKYRLTKKGERRLETLKALLAVH